MKLINSNNLQKALELFYAKANTLYATKTELSTGLAGKANSTHGTHVTWATNAPQANGTAAIGTVNRVAREDHVHPLQTTISGNAGSATKLATARTLSWTGDATGSLSFDGTADKSAALTLAASGVTEGSYGPADNASPAHKGTFSVPYFTVDSKGRITAASTKTITLPADNNTDSKVKNTLGTTTKFYVTGTTSATTATGEQYFDTGVYVSATAGELVATKFTGALNGTASNASKVANSLSIKLNGGTTEGTDLFTFNGSAAKAIDITPAKIGASASGHTHDDRYYTESEINTKVNTLNTAISTAQTNATNAAKTYTDTAITNLVNSAPEAMNTLKELSDAIEAHQDVYEAYVEEMTTALAGKANSSHGNHVPTVETANNAKFLRNDNTWATVTPANIGAAPTSHASTATTYGAASASNYGHAMASSTTPKAAGTAAVGSETAKFARGDHVHPLQTTVSGNAGTATKFESAQSVALTGDVTGSASSQAGWSVTTTLANSGVTAGSYGPSADAAPAHKGTFTVPYITVDAKGRITSASTKTITLPADNNSTYTNHSLGNGYGSCETAEATAAKVVTLSGYNLQINGVVAVKFKYAVPASATMNINSKGAKNVFFRGAAITAGIIKAGDIATFVYDGTQYQLLAIDRWQNDLTSHTHNYAGSSSAGGAATSANKVNSALSIQLNGGTATTFNGSAAKSINITPASIGASASGHTHNYAGSSSAGGAATSANKVNSNLVIKLNGGTTEGTDMFTFNGSAAKTVNLECATDDEITALVDAVWGA